MMERTEAIKILSGLLDAFDQDEHGDYFYDYGWEVCEATILSIAAMREQEQRKQGCEYCNGLPDEQREDFTMPNASKKDYDIVKINFCPMCGAKMDGERRGA